MANESSSATVMGVGAASERLGLSGQTVRNYLDTGKLTGGRRAGGRWEVNTASVESHLAKFGRKRQDHNDLATLTAEVQRLAAAVESLRGREPEFAEDIGALTRERDRYRSDAAAVRAAAHRLNAAAGDCFGAMQQTFAVLEQQREALAQLLGPGSTEDLVT